MAEARMKLNLPLRAGSGDRTSVEIDGQEIRGAVRAVTVRADVHEPTTVELELSLVTVEVEGVAQVLMSKATRDLLQAYGWTPPADEEETDHG